MRLDQTLRFAEYGLLPVELQQSENCKLKSNAFALLVCDAFVFHCKIV